MMWGPALREAQMRLDDDVEPPCSDEAAWIRKRVSRYETESETYYARGKDRPSSFMTSAIHIVAERDTPTRQCTSVAVPSSLPFSVFAKGLAVSSLITALLGPTYQ